MSKKAAPPPALIKASISLTPEIHAGAKAMAKAEKRSLSSWAAFHLEELVKKARKVVSS